MKTGFYPRYDQMGASSRWRFFLYYRKWRELFPEDAIFIKPGLSNRYLQKLYRAGRVPRLTQAAEICRMLLRSFALPDKMIIEYELVPGLPYKYEKKLIGDRKYILNFDDNVWVKYQHNAALSDKYDLLCRNAAGVIVANDFLYKKVTQLNKNVILIPTVVDLDKYQQPPPEKFEKFTFVWIGTPVTYSYLEQFLPVLQELFNTPERELLIIADANLQNKRPLTGVNTRYVNWSTESECQLLQQSHIGIMPLVDDEFSRGKSAFKLLQYQAAGLPLIASPVGENNRIVENNVNGFLAETLEDWRNAVQALSSSELYKKCSEGSLQKAYDYSLQKYFEVFRNFVIESFS